MKIFIVISYSDGALKAFYEKEKAHEYANNLALDEDNGYPAEELYIAGVDLF